MPIKTVAEAINEATAQLLAESPNYFVIGEGLSDRKRAFGTVPQHERVFDMPVSENGMTGVCIGAAVAGMRPIMVHMRADFLLYSADQLINNAAKWFRMFGGQRSCPLVIRAVIGRGWGQGMQHSQHFEELFGNIPGLRIVCPSNAYDAKGLLIGAARDPNPVLFLEHRWIHELKCEVPTEMYEIMPRDINKIAAEPIRDGDDFTLLAWGYMVHECMKAAEMLSGVGIECTVIDAMGPIESSESSTLVVKELSNCPPAFALSRGFYPTASSIATKIAHRFNKTIAVDPIEFHDVPNPDFTGPF